jgi:DNA-directed RNA polymerase specialized sigma24 family protein
MANNSRKLPARFHNLLRWLDPDNERSVERYYSIRRGLVKIFEIRGCWEAEEMADLTIDRVIEKVDSVADSFDGDPAAFFFGVAKRVFLEFRRQPVSIEYSQSFSPTTEGQEEPSPYLDCLDSCLAGLSPERHRLIISYYSYGEGQKIADRKRMAAEAGLSIGALRLKAYRIRNALEKCIKHCLEKKM